MTETSAQPVEVECAPSGAESSSSVAPAGEDHGAPLSAVHVVPENEPILHIRDENCQCGPNVQLELRDDGSTGWVLHHHSLNLEEA